ncbi:hypothetical protein [Kitasatospora sp. NPDC090091]|uniref:hypothetical protein n=1 Tax=Kitasatospora sp. NPDC090091 TaxID=3364081 RepID=UPI00382D80C6
MDHTPTAPQSAAATTTAAATITGAATATDPQLLLNALDHQFRGFRTFWFDRISPAGPLVLPAARGAELERASVRLAGLLRRAASGLGADCLARHRALGLDERLTAFYADEEFEQTYATAIGRPDVMLTESGWKFIEFNFCSATGGQVFTHLLNDLWRQLLPGRAADSLVLPDPMAARNDLLRGVLAEYGLEPRLALIGYLPDVFVTDRRYYEIEIDALRKGGIDAEYFDTDEFTDALATRAGEFPLVLERVVPQEWLDAGRDLTPLLTIRKCGATVLTPQSSYQAANKQLFAALSAGLDWMTDDDREFVATYLPWSRSIREETVEFEGESWTLTDLLVRRREEFVLKRSDGDQNADVHLGFRTGAAEWEAVIAKAREAGTWIVQQAVHSADLAVTVLDAGSREYRPLSTKAVFGPLVIGGRTAGCPVRYEVPAPLGSAPGTPGSSILGTAAWGA